MANPTIEGLLIERGRHEKLSPFQMQAQLYATRVLVDVVHKRLLANIHDRDASFNSPQESHRFDAFYLIPELNVAIEINSVGQPAKPEKNGLFLYIKHRDEEGKIQELVGLQTAKRPEVVNEEEALWLSVYKPMQLLAIAQLVLHGNPITPHDYTAWLKEPSIPKEQA